MPGQPSTQVYKQLETEPAELYGFFPRTPPVSCRDDTFDSILINFLAPRPLWE